MFFPHLERLYAVAPFLISQCYNHTDRRRFEFYAVAPFLISQCYNVYAYSYATSLAVAPFLISQCYNISAGNPYFIRIPRFLLSKKRRLEQQ